MAERPVLDKSLDSKTFQEFYYLKEELIEFCRTNNLLTAGGKLELTERIAYFLDTGKILPVTSKSKKKRTAMSVQIDEATIIESDFVCSEKHRAFFKEHIGSTFSFPVAFQKWLKSNAGKTYKDAINAYYQILEDKKKSKSVIDRQFEYNTYIRDFLQITKERHWKRLSSAGSIKNSSQVIIVTKSQTLITFKTGFTKS